LAGFFGADFFGVAFVLVFFLGGLVKVSIRLRLLVQFQTGLGGWIF